MIKILGAENAGIFWDKMIRLYFPCGQILFLYGQKRDSLGKLYVFIWSKRVFTRSKISVLLGQMDFYMVSKNKNNKEHTEIENKDPASQQPATRGGRNPAATATSRGGPLPAQLGQGLAGAQKK